MSYKVSVVMPAYNAEKFIEEAICSVVNQSMNSLELIIVNDGSTDSTEKICQRMACLHQNIKYIRVPNGGAGKARNIGIEMATGTYIMFLDSDDLYIANALNKEFEKRLEKYSENNIDIIYTCRARINVDLSGEPWITKPETLDSIKHNMPTLEFGTCIYRREYLQEKKISFFEYQKQDIETAFRFRAFSKTTDIIVAPDILFYLQRDNPDSNTHTFNYYYLYSIKTIVYAELLQEFLVEPCKNDNKFETLYFLNKEVAKFACKYFLYLIRYPNKEDFIYEQTKNVKNAVKHLNIIAPSKIKNISVSNAVKYYVFFFCSKLLAVLK